MLKAALLIAFFALAPGAAQQDYAPGTFELTPTVDLQLQPVPLQVPEQFKDLVPADRILHLPPGFSASVFAVADLWGPRFMAWSPDGVLHVANMRVPGVNQGQIVALPDADGDGVADQTIVVASGFRRIHSLAFYQGALYAADTHQLLRLRDSDGDGLYQERQVVAELPVSASDIHPTRTLLVDAAAEKLYVSVGSTCDICRDADPERATILQFNSDGSGRRIFASGLRNPVGLTHHPLSGELWATNNGHDRQGSVLPPEVVYIVRDGAFYGWPLAYAYQIYVDLSVVAYDLALAPLTRADSLLVQRMPRPVALAPARLAPMSIHFYTHELFPERYRNNAFIAYRAGHNSAAPGYRVKALFSEADGSNARLADFITGFQPNPPTTDGVWGTPVGLITDAAGRLYLTSDFVNNLVLRIDYDPAADFTTNVEEAGPALPRHFTLEQNVPNPFNSSTLIRFALPTAATVDLGLYNLAGQRLKTLSSGSFDMGNYAVPWDGRDQHGRDLASGVYLYRLQTDKHQETRKLLLLR